MNQYRTIVVADHHKRIFVCQVLDKTTGESTRRTLTSSRRELEPFLRDLPGPVLVFIEACRSWEWVSDMCEDLSIDLRLVDPCKMPEISRSRKKTDHHDVEAMVQRLLVAGELPRSYRASRSERELRGLTRRLSEIRHARASLFNRIHALVDAHGLPATKTRFEKVDWRESMQADLSPDAWLALHSLLREVDVLRQSRKEIEERVAELMKGREDAQRLKKIPGVADVTAATIIAESAGIQRFGKARQYAAFTGLTPRARNSGGKTKLGRISRSGPPDLRWALYQAAFSGLRSKQFNDVTATMGHKRKKGKHFKTAMCAAAHKLARAVFVVLARGEEYRLTSRSAPKAA